MSKRLNVLKALTTFLEGSNPDNGYGYDFRNKVYRGRDRFGAEYVAKMPFLSILEAKSTDYGNFAN